MKLCILDWHAVKPGQHYAVLLSHDTSNYCGGRYCCVLHPSHRCSACLSM